MDFSTIVACSVFVTYPGTGRRATITAKPTNALINNSARKVQFALRVDKKLTSILTFDTEIPNKELYSEGHQ